MRISNELEKKKEEEKKMPFIVATYISASSQGQRTHSARTNNMKSWNAIFCSQHAYLVAFMDAYINKILQNPFCSLLNGSLDILKKLEFRFLRLICCGYSKSVPQDAWLVAKGISSITICRAEKTSKTCLVIDLVRLIAKTVHFGCFLSSGRYDWVRHPQT